MHYVALATDYDGTIAHDGVVDPATLASLERLRVSNRKLILVTGRELDDLMRVMPRIDVFDRVVAENGAVLYRPETKETRLLAPEPPPAFVEALRAASVDPLSIGRAIVATWEPNETKVLSAIRDLGLDLQITFNKGAVMVLPAGVNKESGLRAALEELEISPHNTVAVGDAENDFAFFSLCGMPVALANALPMLKQAAVLVTQGVRGAGVTELIDRLLATDLAELDADNQRQLVALAAPLEGGELLEFVPQRQSLLLAGTSGGGTRRRHLRKYAEGKLGDDRAFFFRGPDSKLNLRAGNLMTFLEMGAGIDLETWEYHRRQGDFSRWIELSIKDRELTAEIAGIERGDQPFEAAREAIQAAIERRYTLPA